MKVLGQKDQKWEFQDQKWNFQDQRWKFQDQKWKFQKFVHFTNNQYTKHQLSRISVWEVENLQNPTEGCNSVIRTEIPKT